MMYFASHQPQSYIDYPGKISSVVYTQGCNFNCSYCHNRELISREYNEYPQPIANTTILEYLTKRKNLIEGLVITGGEPTLHKELIPFCKQVKELGYKIKLDTNGSNPSMLKLLIDKELVDYVAMDIKGDLSSYMKLWPDYKEGVLQQSINVLQEGDCLFEFRTTCDGYYADQPHWEGMCKLVQNIDSFTHINWYLQKAVSVKTAMTEHEISLMRIYMSAQMLYTSINLIER